jgi:hypothetical protein
VSGLWTWTTTQIFPYSSFISTFIRSSQDIKHQKCVLHCAKSKSSINIHEFFMFFLKTKAPPVFEPAGLTVCILIFLSSFNRLIWNFRVSFCIYWGYSHPYPKWVFDIFTVKYLLRTDDIFIFDRQSTHEWLQFNIAFISVFQLNHASPWNNFIFRSDLTLLCAVECALFSLPYISIISIFAFSTKKVKSSS